MRGAVAFTTPEQLARILDVDIWRVRTPGVDEAFDADRFGVWIEVLMHAGAPVAAQKLIGLDIVADLRCKDRDIQLRLHALARELARHLRDGAPWRARHALEVLVMLDAPSWAALLALIDECPVMHAAVAPRHSRHAINVGDFEFISHNSQINAVRVLMESLPSTLTR